MTTVLRPMDCLVPSCDLRFRGCDLSKQSCHLRPEVDCLVPKSIELLPCYMTVLCHLRPLWLISSLLRLWGVLFGSEIHQNVTSLYDRPVSFCDLRIYITLGQIFWIGTIFSVTYILMLVMTSDKNTYSVHTKVEIWYLPGLVRSR